MPITFLYRDQPYCLTRVGRLVRLPKMNRMAFEKHTGTFVRIHHYYMVIDYLVQAAEIKDKSDDYDYYSTLREQVKKCI
jgi:hypothetical protein